ncbi:MAG: hypothetical protein RL391_736 [Actinomycetota bacterium]|jgi:hypothetical protein
MSELTQRELVEHLVADRRLTQAEGDEILNAPRIVLSFRETVSYLAAVIIAVGLVRLAVALFDEASEVLIAVLLYVVSAVAGFVSYRFEKKSGWRMNAGEILEMASVGAFVGAGALLLVNADVEAAWIAVAAGTVGAAWSLVRLPSSHFGASITMVPSAIAVCAGTIELLDIDSGLTALPFAVTGCLLIAPGQGRVGFSVLLRVAGTAMIVIATPGFVAEYDGINGLLPALVVGCLLFATGVQWSRLEQVGGGALVIVISVAAFIFQNVDNDVLQGVLVALVGIAALGGSTLVVRRHQRAYVTTTGA